MAYAASTLTTIRTRVARELDLALLIPNAYFDAAAAGSITSANLLRNSNWGSTYFQNKNTIIFRPGAATAADQIRWAGALTNTTGLLAHTGANYADTTVGTETVELWYDDMRPDLEFLAAINRALEFEHFSTYVPISHLTGYNASAADMDGDMASSATTAYSATNSSLTKVTTPTKVPYGIRALRIANSGTGGYAQSSTVALPAGKQFTAFAIAAVTASAFTLQPYDITNSANMTMTTPSTDVEPMLVQIPWSGAPTTCAQMALRLVGTSSAADVAVNGLWLYKQDDLRINFPSYVSEAFMAPSIFQAIPRWPSAANGVWDAQGLVLTQLEEGKDYHLMFHQPDANPYGAVFTKPTFYNWPLFIQARRPYIDLTTNGAGLNAESDTTTAPLHILIPRIKIQVLETVLIPRFPTSTKAQVLLMKAKEELAGALLARAVEPVAKQLPYFSGVEQA